MTRLRRVCVFAGSSPGARPAYADTARALGRGLAQEGVGVVYGGGHVGLMGALADAALGAGGEVIGVIPQALLDREVGHQGLTALRVVGSMHERKALMHDLADGFVALPGGLGTLEELSEILTWAQLGIHRKPIVLLDVEEYWAPLMTLVDRAVTERFVPPAHRALLLEARSAGEALARLRAFDGAAPVTKWMDRDAI